MGGTSRRTSCHSHCMHATSNPAGASRDRSSLEPHAGHSSMGAIHRQSLYVCMEQAPRQLIGTRPILGESLDKLRNKCCRFLRSDQMRRVRARLDNARKFFGADEPVAVAQFDAD